MSSAQFETAFPSENTIRELLNTSLNSDYKLLATGPPMKQQTSFSRLYLNTTFRKQNKSTRLEQQRPVNMAVAVQSAQISLETMSDNIDSVNVHKTDLQKDRGLYDESKFDKSKDKAGFRQFEDACDQVKTFYAQQHTLQTVAYNLKARNDFTNKTRAHMTVWEAMEKLNTFIDECDPDTSET
jgi:hypothetical protein